MHAELVAREVTGASLAAVFDAHSASANEVARDLGVPVAESLEDLVGAADAVAICSPTDTHAELITIAVEAGCAVFCEKPVSLDLRHLDEALSAVERSGVPFQIGFNRRFDPAHAAVAAAVAAGIVGAPHLVRISSRDPHPPPLDYVRSSGGLFVDMTIHDFDMARFVTGSEVVEVFARGAVRIDPDIGEAGDIDTAVTVLVHANGCLTTIDNSRQAVYGFDQRVEVFGSEGMAASDNPPAHSATVATSSNTQSSGPPYFFLERYRSSYVREWTAFVASVAAGTQPSPGVADARAPLVIGLAAARSMRDGGPVRVEEV